MEPSSAAPAAAADHSVATGATSAPRAAEPVIVAPDQVDPTADIPPTIIEKASHDLVNPKEKRIQIEYDTSLPSIENFVALQRYVGTSYTPPKSAFVSPPPLDVVEVGGIELIQLQAAPQAQESDASEQPQSLDHTDSEDWLSRERNSFDWEAVATLATSALSKVDMEEDDEDARAAMEWENTDWDSPPSSGKDQVATVLMRLARRIKNGDLVIDTTKAASIEAALASVLSALLSEQAGKQRKV